ncbi:MAG TPA: response regulator [Rickettsiales bacterium]|nr:response regulator [Rickettsiales bacterium]
MNKPSHTELVSAFQPTLKQMEIFVATMKARSKRSKIEILVVEDQPFSRQLLTGLLKQFYTVHAAADAREGWTSYLNYAPDIVMLDIELPDMDGNRLAKLISSIDRLAYIILVTANNKIEYVQQAKEIQAKGFVVKPYSKDKILSVIQKFVSERNAKG